MWGAKRKWGGKSLAFPPASGKALRSHFSSHKIISRSKALKIPCIGPSRLWYCYIINVPPLHASLEDSSGLQDITEMNCIDFECTFFHTSKQKIKEYHARDDPLTTGPAKLSKELHTMIGDPILVMLTWQFSESSIVLSYSGMSHDIPAETSTQNQCLWTHHQRDSNLMRQNFSADEPSSVTMNLGNS